MIINDYKAHHYFSVKRYCFLIIGFYNDILKSWIKKFNKHPMQSVPYKRTPSLSLLWRCILMEVETVPLIWVWIWLLSQLLHRAYFIFLKHNEIWQMRTRWSTSYGGMVSALNFIAGKTQTREILYNEIQDIHTQLCVYICGWPSRHYSLLFVVFPKEGDTG